MKIDYTKLFTVIVALLVLIVPITSFIPITGSQTTGGVTNLDSDNVTVTYINKNPDSGAVIGSIGITYAGVPIAEYNPEYWKTKEGFFGTQDNSAPSFEFKLTVNKVISWGTSADSSALSERNVTINVPEGVTSKIVEGSLEGATLVESNDGSYVFAKNIIRHGLLVDYYAEGKVTLELTYTFQVPFIFGGWKYSLDDTEIIHPGAALDATSDDITLYANWITPTLYTPASLGFSHNMRYEGSYEVPGIDYVVSSTKNYLDFTTEGVEDNDYIKSVSNDPTGGLYSNIYHVSGIVEPENLNVGTYRSVNGGSIQISKPDGGIFEHKFDNTVLNGSVILDNIELIGFESEATEQTMRGLYANGNLLIIGTGVTCQNNIEVYGGSHSNENSIPRTDVRIFSGTYTNVFGGSGSNSSGSNLNVSMSVTIVGDTEVREMVVGGEGVQQGGTAREIGSTHVLVGGNAKVNEKTYSGGYIDSGFSVVIAGSRNSDVGTSNVTITGNAQVFAVQGGGRELPSVTDNANVTVSGKSKVSVVCGSVTNGRDTGDDYPVGSVTISVKGSPTIAALYGGGWDVYYNPAKKSTERISISIGADGGSPSIGVVFGGGFRGDVGKEGNDSISITIDSGMIGAVYGGGRGGPDIFASSPGKGNTTGSADVYGNVSITLNGGNVDENVSLDGVVSDVIGDGVKNGCVYGGGYGAVKQIGDSSGNLDSGEVKGSVDITLGSDASVGGSIYGAGRGAEGSDYGDLAKVTGDVSIHITGKVDNESVAGSVYGGGQFGRLVDANVTIDISDARISGSVYGGGLNGEVSASSVSIALDGSDISSVYGGGYNGLVTSSSLVINLSESDVTGAVYGGGYNGNVELDSGYLSITISDDDGKDNSVGSVYGGGYNGSVTSSSLSIGLSHAKVIHSVYGGGLEGEVEATTISLNIEEATVGGSVYGGGQNGVATSSQISVGIDGGTYGAVFGGGEGAGAILTTDRIAVTIDGTATVGSIDTQYAVFGGGEYAKSTVSDEAYIILGKGVTVNGDVHGGGMGSNPSVSIMDADRTVVVNGAYVNGNVYGGSRDGGDGSNGNSYSTRVLLIAGVVMQGVFGGGFQGQSYTDISILIGTAAVEAADRSYGIVPAMSSSDTIGLRLNSIYGGGNIDQTQAGKDLVHGDVGIEISANATSISGGTFPGYPSSKPGEAPNAAKISIYGYILGEGNYSKVADGFDVSIYIHDYVQNNVYNIKSIQQADELRIEDSDIALEGSVDAGATELTKLLTIAKVGTVVLDGSNLELYRETTGISEYRSEVDGKVATKSDCVPVDGKVPGNTVVLHNGISLEIRTEGIGTVSGYTLMSRPDGDTYYGAFAFSTGKVGESGFMIDDGAEEASLLITSDGIHFWYIAGYMTVNEQLNYTSKKSWGVGTGFVLPMLSKGSLFVYLGSYVSPTIQGGVLVVEKEDFESFDVSLKTDGNYTDAETLMEKVGESMFLSMELSDHPSSAGGSEGSGSTVSAMTHVYKDGVFERVFSVDASGGYDVVSRSNTVYLDSVLLSSELYKLGYGSSGSIGTVTIHLAEVATNSVGGIPINMIDLTVSMYVEPLSPKENVVDIFVTVMVTPTGTNNRYSGRGYIDLPIAAGPRNYDFIEYESTLQSPEISMWSDMTHLGISGWNVIRYSDTSGNLFHPVNSGTQEYLGQGTGVRISTIAFDYVGAGSGSFTMIIGEAIPGSTDGTHQRTINVKVNIQTVESVDVGVSYHDIEAKVDMYLSHTGAGTMEEPYELTWVAANADGTLPEPMAFEYEASLSTKTAWFKVGTVVDELTYERAFEMMLDMDASVGDEVFNYEEHLYGWFTDPSHLTKFRMSSPVNESVTLYAGCAIEVTFHGNGVILTHSTVYVSPGESLHEAGYNNISENADGRTQIYEQDGNGRAGYHLNGDSWVDATGAVFSFDSILYFDTDLYLPWEADSYTMTIEISGVEDSGDIVLPEGVYWTLSGSKLTGTVTVQYESTFTLSLDDTDHSYRIESSKLQGKDVGETGGSNLTFTVPLQNGNGAKVTLEVSVILGYRVIVEFDDSIGSTREDDEVVRVTYSGETADLDSRNNRISFVVETLNGTASLDLGVKVGKTTVDGFADSVYHWSRQQVYEDGSLSELSQRSGDNYRVNLSDDLNLVIHVHRQVGFSLNTGVGIESMTYSWEGGSDTLSKESTKVYDGDIITIVPVTSAEDNSYTLPLTGYGGVVQIGSSYQFRVTGDPVWFGDLTLVVRYVEVTVQLFVENVQVTDLRGFTVSLSGPDGTNTYPGTNESVWKVEFPYNTAGTITASVHGFKDASGTPVDGKLTLRLDAIPYEIRYHSVDGNLLESELQTDVTVWYVTDGPVKPSFGRDYTAIGTFSGETSSRQAWTTSSGNIVREVDGDSFGLSTVLDLYALPPLTGEGLTGDTTLITIIVQSDDVNGTHEIVSVGSGTYTAVVNGATVSFRFIEGADGVGSLLISGFPEGTVVGTMHLTLGPVELTLVIHPAVVGA